MSVCQAVIQMLRSSYDPSEFDNARLDFEVYVAKDFTDRRITEGVSLFLYRINHDGTHRTPPGRLQNGTRQRSKLPLDLYFLLTAWASSASLQHKLAGWMMRTLEDNPILPAGLLNVPHSGVFWPDETVDVALTDLSVDDMFHIWEVMINHVYQLSVPYVARVVQIESALLEPAVRPVVERRGDYAVTPARPWEAP